MPSNKPTIYDDVIMSLRRLSEEIDELESELQALQKEAEREGKIKHT